MKLFKITLCSCLSLILLACLIACGADDSESGIASSAVFESNVGSNSSVGAEESEASGYAASEVSSENGSDSSITDETQGADNSEQTSADTSSDETSEDNTSSVETSQEPGETENALGTEENPASMAMGKNTVALIGSGEYYYSLTATENAVLVLEFSGEGKTGWSYRVDNLTAGSEFSENGKSSDTDAVSTVFINIFKGDVIQTAVNTETGAAGDVSVKASLLEAWGTESNAMPIQIGQTDYLRVPGGETVYFSGRAQNTTMVLTGNAKSVLVFDGESYQLTKGKLELEMPKSEGGKAEVLIFALTNNTSSTQVYSVTCNFPLGTSSNPDKVKLGGNSVKIEAGSQYGYVYEWTATEKGSVTITMTSKNWHYEILNINSMAQEQSTSKETSPVKEASVKVRPGQVIRITINTGDSKEATVTFNFSFEKAE